MVSTGEKRYTRRMDIQNTARAKVAITPSHGQGRIMPWQPGQSGNPGGKPTGMKELRAQCRKISAPGVKALERILTETVIDEHGNIRNAHEGKVIVAAMQIALTWGYGKPPEYDPKEDEPGVRIDTSSLSPVQRKALLDALRAGVLRPADDVPEHVGETIESSGQEIVVADRQPVRDDD